MVIKKINGKKGQLTLFIIIAIVIIGVIIILLTLTDTGKNVVKNLIGTQTANVEQDVKNCIDKSEFIKNNIRLIEVQGGYLNPKNYILYNNFKVEYLCYTNEYLKTCVMQHPLVLNDIKSEIKTFSETEINKCVNEMKKDLESEGYKVNLGKLNLSIEIIPDNIIFNINYPITIQKEDVKTYNNFRIKKASSLYQLIMLGTSILNYESRYGDSDPLTFMTLYPNLKVDKQKQGDGSKIYILSDRDNEDSFTFATRSLVWPAGYFGAQK